MKFDDIIEKIRNDLEMYADDPVNSYSEACDRVEMALDTLYKGLKHDTTSSTMRVNLINIATQALRAMQDLGL
jgi:hypothetical protein